MHKKSMEAAHKLKEDDDGKPLEDVMEDIGAPNVVNTNSKMLPNKEEFRTESIAALRAKAQTYTAKIREGLGAGQHHMLNNNNNGHLMFPLSQMILGNQNEAANMCMNNMNNMNNINDSKDTTNMCTSRFEPPRRDIDDNSTCDSETLDPTNWCQSPLNTVLCTQPSLCFLPRLCI